MLALKHFPHNPNTIASIYCRHYAHIVIVEDFGYPKFHFIVLLEYNNVNPTFYFKG